ncbi:MAG: hypothetical protein V7641_4755 [Blastocatellia bacterium]
MQKACAVILMSLLMNAAAMGQKRKKPRHPSRSHTAAARPIPPSNGPRMVGSSVIIITKNDDRIVGTLVDLTAYSVRIKADNLESTISLDRIASLSFGDTGSASRATQTSAPASGDFARNAGPVLSAFQNIANQLQQGTEFNEYGRLLTDLRRRGDQFINRYGASENANEARIVALLSAALTDYTWARTIWTLRLNRSGDTTAFDTDTPALADALALYPDLRASAAVGNKFSVDKIVSGLWKKAADKIDRARTLTSDAK